MNCKLLVLVLTLVFLSCGNKESKLPTTSAEVRLPNAPPEMEAMIKKAFPGAITAPKFADSVIRYLQGKYGITPNKILIGASTCGDDIIYTKNFHAHPDIKGPFHLGGLAGLPFSGVSGLTAFAHHIPDSGTMLLLIEPHIGYSAKKGWGYVLRQEQHEVSTCCGALMGTLDKMAAGTLVAGIKEDDYQASKIGELALSHKKEILEAESPIIEFTHMTSNLAAEKIRAHLLDVDVSHMKYIVVITGAIINTDYMFTDYQYVSNILIYDARKKTFVEELTNR